MKKLLPLMLALTLINPVAAVALQETLDQTDRPAICNELDALNEELMAGNMKVNLKIFSTIERMKDMGVECTETVFKGATHPEDQLEKTRYEPSVGTDPIYRQIKTPPNLLYTELPEKYTYITDDMGMAAYKIDSHGNVVWKKSIYHQTYFGIAPINEDEFLLSLYSDGEIVKINTATDKEELFYSGYYRDIVITADNKIVLVENIEEGKVLLLDMDGEVLWESNPQFFYARSAWQKEDGNILVVDFNHKAYEIDYNTKEIIWEMDGFNHPNSIQEMDNKNYLISDEHNNRIVEVDPSSNEIVRVYGEGLWSPNYARELENGNWLISDADNHRVIEVTSEDKIVWELYNMHTPNRAVRAE